jgi:4-cresol dehydrogenase (hydroxylating)
MERFATLPAGVSAARFTRAVAGFRAAVGPEQVYLTPEQLSPWTRVMLPFDDDAFTPAGVVSPATVEEVQGVVAVCNRYGVPLWPVSTGRNFGYGSALPATRGQVILDLKRLNRILEVDPVLGTALVEPGVTYQQLHDYLREHNIPLWLDFPAPGPLASPMGNTLERGGGQTPYGDHFGNCCGMEVVLGDGTLLRTGLGGIPGTRSWQAYKYGFGPYLDGIFTQSNFGVVTKLGLWLMPAPPAHLTFMAMWPDRDAVARAVETLRPLRYDGTIGNFGVLVNDALLMTNFHRRVEVYTGSGAVTDAAVRAVAAPRGIEPWCYLFSLYGRPELIQLNTRIVTEALEASGAKLIAGVHDPMQVNELTLQAFTLLNWIGSGGLAWFAPVAPCTGADVARQNRLARAIMDAHGIDFFSGATLNGREVLNVMPLVFNRDEADERRRARSCFEELLTRFAEQGYGMYRTGIGFMDRVAELHGATLLAVNRRIKQALDPHGILAPGKSGIHPLRSRV